MWGVSLTHPVLASFLSGEFLLHIPSSLAFSYYIYILHIQFFFFLSLFFFGGVFLTHLVLVSFLSGEFLLHIPCWLHFSMGSLSFTSRAGFIFIWGVSLTHPMLCFFCCVFFYSFILFLYLGNFSYTSRGRFLSFFLFILSFIWGVSLTHPVLASSFCFLCGEILWNAVFSEDNPRRKELRGRWP